MNTKFYTVWYKRTSSLFWSKLPRVKADGLIEHGRGRFFIQDSEARVEIPVDAMLFRFSPERFDNIKRQMEIEASRSIPANSQR